eukprot:Hpha_TRINITY_DN12418_c0_g1::TRINITY_DN12418_c0_g1_i1::g.42778::m.42778
MPMFMDFPQVLSPGTPFCIWIYPLVFAPLGGLEGAKRGFRLNAAWKSMVPLTMALCSFIFISEKFAGEKGPTFSRGFPFNNWQWGQPRGMGPKFITAPAIPQE